MPTTHVTIPTADGPCAATLHAPAGEGPFPAVILVPDAGGMRPAPNAMAERISSWGYVVVVYDVFHRTGSIFDMLPGKPHTMASIRDIFGDDELKKKFFGTYYAGAVAPDHVRTDFTGILDYLATRPEVKQGRAGVTGYCMGGNIAFQGASLVPERLGLVASFHGGGLVDGSPNSPHLGAPKIEARVYVGGAIEDASFPDQAKATLIAALDAAHVKSTVETYAGCHHGWTVPDGPSYNEAGAERHYEVLKTLLHETL